MHLFTKIAIGLQAVSAVLTTISQTLPVVPAWVPLAITGLGVLSTLAAKMAPAGLQPSPTLPNDQDAATAKAAGAAGAAASKGPFGGAR